jgi:hypothetical protein
MAGSAAVRCGLPALVALLLCALSGVAQAQLFLAARPNPPFAIGPLFIRARVTPTLGPVPVDVFWGLVVPSGSRAGVAAQDLYLLWPGAVSGVSSPDTPDPALTRDLEAGGFAIRQGGRLRLAALHVTQTGRTQSSEPVKGGAPFVVAVRDGGPMGGTTPATIIRIPWTSRLADPEWLMDLQLMVPNLIIPKTATWLEKVFQGPRQRLSLSFNDVRSRVLFPLYFARRDRVVHLADEPSELLLTFAGADRLRIDDISPPSSSRRRGEVRENTEVVSLFLERSEGLTPQTVTVEFAYLSGIQAWAPILIPTLFFVLGNLAGVLVRAGADRVRQRLAGRVLLGPAGDGGGRRQTGVILSRDTLEQIEPGATTYEQVLQLCGPNADQVEQFPSAAGRTLVYRGHRRVPRGHRRFGWLTTVSHWDTEEHEVEVAFERDVVRDVKAHVRKSRGATT